MTHPKCILALILYLPTLSLWAQTDVLTANYDNNRTGAKLDEQLLNTTNVNPGQFGRLYSFPVDGQVYAQPLYVNRLSIQGLGVRNVVITATMHNSVYLLDADALDGTDPIWQVHLGKSVDVHDYDEGSEVYTDIQREIGILGTPVVDRSSQTVYVANLVSEAGIHAYYLHALDLTTGAEKFHGPVKVEASVPGPGWAIFDAPGAQLAFQARNHIQRPGLLLSGGRVYVAFGSHADMPPWHGWLFGYSAVDLQQPPAAFCTTAYNAGASIWQSGRGIAGDITGEIYLGTGNGDYDGAYAWGESILHVSPRNGLKVVDWFTPAEWNTWNEDDLDFGSSGPILVPGLKWLIAAGKSGELAVMDRAKMGHEWTEAAGLVQRVQIAPWGIFNAALWPRADASLLYLLGQDMHISAYRLENGKLNTTAVSVNSTLSPGIFAGMVITANGTTPGSGILWMTTPDKPGADGTKAGTLRALDAAQLDHELWNSDMQADRDSLGNLKFANPTVANGKVFVPTDSMEIAVYGLLAKPGIRNLANAASLRTSSISGGEIISIFGTSIGPADQLGAAIDASGRIDDALGDVRVTFDGMPAPLLSVSAGKIDAIVPFAVAGKDWVTMEVTAPGGTAYSVPVPVTDATPSIFTAGGGGSGQGAILNSDGTLNSPQNPAARGSIISIFATGTGPLVPAVVDGQVLTVDGTWRLALAASVNIGGTGATVVYQGGAPGAVAGAAQINAVIPANARSGAAVPIRIGIGIGNQISPNRVTVAIQ